MAYSFKKQLEIGEYFAQKIDKWILSTSVKNYKALYPVEELQIQKLGIDRFAIDEHGFKHAIEYKTDLRAHSTENIFLETEVNNKPGWIHKCISSEVYVYVPQRGTLIQFDMPGIRKLLLDYSHLKPKTVWNKGFTAAGIVVPLKKAKEYATIAYYRKSLIVAQEEVDEIRK